MFTKYFSAALFLLISLVGQNAFALDNVWLFKGVYIEEVTFYDGGSDNILQLRLSDVSQPTETFTCGPTSQAGVVGLTAGSGNQDKIRANLSAALAAQAQHLPVDVIVNKAGCDTSSRDNDNTLTYPNASSHSGIGLDLRGIRVRYE
ncbi:MAG: hypothetical protein P1U67_12430 [Alcanivoracaceae bacterium]|nr:hypothetical protein [Alcanivoracaceae bacterium]